MLLVADSLTGQDAVETAKRFHERLPLTGLVLTRVDGDGRGGAALSMRAVTGLPIKFLGAGERPDALEPFDARRIAGRILGQGDIVGLVEKAVEQVDRDEAEKMAKKLAKGRFDFDDMEKQLGQLIQIGGLKGVMGMLPGVQKMKNQISEAQLDDKQIHRQIGIIRSMTKAERAKPDLINGTPPRPHRQGRRRRGRGGEPPPQDAPQHGRHGQGHGQGQNALRHARHGRDAQSPRRSKQLGVGPARCRALTRRADCPGSSGGLPGLPGSDKKS